MKTCITISLGLAGLLGLSGPSHVSQRDNLDRIADSIVRDIPSGANIVWLGESHGTKANAELAFELFHRLDRIGKIDYIIEESGYLDGEEMNRFMQSGDTSILVRNMNKHYGTFAWTRDMFDYYVKIYNSQRDKPIPQRTTFVGIDLAHDYWNYHAIIRDSIALRHVIDPELVLARIPAELPKIVDYKNYYGNLVKDIERKETLYRKCFSADFERLRYLIRNVYFTCLAKTAPSKRWDTIRDSLIYENFKELQHRFDFANSRSFAFWGTDHILQEKDRSGTEFIAARIKKNHLDIEQYGCYLLYSKSKFNLPVFFIPKPIRVFFGKKTYISTGGLNNDGMFVPVNGMSHLKSRMDGEESHAFFAANTLPDKYDFVRRRKGRSIGDYVQSFVLIRNSPASKPLYHWKGK